VRLGLFGGSFDPPHVGHLLLASDAWESLALDRVVFIPACQQPLKVGLSLAPPEARLRMLLDMVDGDPRFEVDSTEIDRGGLSYTVDTLRVYAERHPDAERFFFLGADSLQSLESWREPAQVVSLARLAILARSGPGDEAVPIEGKLGERVRALAGADGLEPVVVAARRVDISSTEIRARVRAGASIRGFVVDAVSRYIEDSGLYR
jgi:nicotinate-nucleotide adenylyltransferase